MFQKRGNKRLLDAENVLNKINITAKMKIGDL